MIAAATLDALGLPARPAWPTLTNTLSERPVMTRTPQEMELLAIFRQLNDPLRVCVLDTVRESRDLLKREAERLAEGMRVTPGNSISGGLQ